MPQEVTDTDFAQLIAVAWRLCGAINAHFDRALLHMATQFVIGRVDHFSSPIGSEVFDNFIAESSSGIKSEAELIQSLIDKFCEIEKLTDEGRGIEWKRHKQEIENLVSAGILALGKWSEMRP